MSFLGKLRRFWLDVHLWIGIGLLIPFVIIGVTGSLLVWHEPLERQIEPQRYAISEGASAPLALHLDNARSAFGDDFAVTGVRPPETASDPVVVQARATARPPEGQRPQTRSAWLDPATGDVLDIANPRASAFGIMHVLHGSLMIPQMGRKIVGWIGWAMLVSSLTGLWLWWPRNGAFLKALRWLRGPRTTFNLHHMVGFWLVIPLFVLSLTGVYVSFPQESRAFASLFIDAPAPERAGGGPPRGFGGPPPLSETNLSIDEAASAALAEAPEGARIVSIALPTPGRDGAAPSWRVQARVEGRESNLAINIDDLSGDAELSGDRAAHPTDEIARLMRRVHDGVDMGLTWQIIIFLGGWAPALLGVTGVIMWLRRRAARRAIRRGHPRPVQQAK